MAIGVAALFALVWGSAPAQAGQSVAVEQAAVTSQVASPTGEEAGVDHGSIHRWLDCQTCHYVDDGSARSADERRILISTSCEDCHQEESIAAHASWHQGQIDMGNFEAPVCTDCHHAHPPRAIDTAPVSTRVCTTCHTDEGHNMAQSVHSVFTQNAGLLSGTAEGPPSCIDCHDSHAVSAAVGAEPDLCGTCHEGVADQYRGSVHGVGFSHGEADVATCSDCHGDIHEIVAVDSSMSPVFALNLPRTCGECHGDEDLAARHGIGSADVYQLYMDSVHGRALTEDGLLVSASCGTCHGSHDIKAPDEPDSSVNRENVPETCGVCHAGVLAEYEHGVHAAELAKGNKDAPVCTDCHSSHDISPTGSVEAQLGDVKECGACHEESLDTFRDTLHGQVTTLGFTPAAKCSDCHGAHDILPADDPESTVSKANLVATCQQCHETASAGFVEYNPHANAEDRAAFPFLYWVTKFMELLIISVFVFFGAHTLAWFNRSFRVKRRGEHLEHTQAPGEVL